MTLCLALSRPRTLCGDSNVIRLLQPVLLPKSALDERGFSTTTFLCAAEFLQNITMEEFIDVVETLSTKMAIKPKHRHNNTKNRSRRSSSVGSFMVEHGFKA
uniref:Uncharacterized protein n=2 Tax=Amorphochlora amoebiformis TaxID=1561963 RepID=A0A7S0CYQ7_9EUKA|mmetsp:Transcript_15826/g.25061  ORF Transcript_15826/g.25061 Transcript_15826/m.25061 type:complete len:102 (+) Transcript_15826:439-744(+)